MRECGGARGARSWAGGEIAHDEAALAGDRERGEALSHVARVAQNHPQNLLVKDETDCRETPDEFFRELHAEHDFTVDAAANAENAKLPRYWDLSTNGLSQSWNRERVWCNPPFSNLRAWVLKAITETRHNDCTCVVMLLPANRTEQPWWQDLIEPFRDIPGSGIRTRFVRGRIRFRGKAVGPDAATPNENRPPFGCVLVTFTGE